ncbi:MAG: tetratricopeptide repeat protein [Candidatus Eisenbacteria bacterium]|nr:tetratricopeptide repeat protein [Candidatus Eisenbacteria bacterium]
MSNRVSHDGPARRCMTALGPLGLLLAGLLLLLGTGSDLGCGGSATPPRLLLVGIDSADWTLMGPLLERGELPNIQALIDRGMRAQLRSFEPLISPLIWTTIATGKGPDQHGVCDFTMPDPRTGEPIIVTSQVRRSKAFWNILSEAGVRTAVVGWWATWPAEEIDGVIVSDRLNYHAFVKTPEAEQGLVHPPDLLPELLARKEAAAEIPYEAARRFMQVSREEYAASGELDFRDPISHFRHIHQTMTTYAEAAKLLLREARPEVLAVYFEGVDTAGHMYMRYTPPPYPQTTTEERRKFGDTVAAFYRYQDELLGELLALVDERTNVMIVSDHGFASGYERPIESTSEISYATAARWHRIEGALIAAGPQIRSASGDAAIVRNASVFDVTPTLLTILGLPVAEDMEGRILTDLLPADLRPPPPVPTYEDARWREDREAAAAQVRGVDEEMKERLRSLGYIGAGESDAILSLRGRWSLADYYLHKGEYEKAEAELSDLAQQAPDWAEPYYHLGLVHMRRGEFEKAREMYARALELSPEKLEARTNLAFILRQQGEREAAIALLEEALPGHPYDGGLRVNLAILHREAQRFAAAESLLREAQALNPANPIAHAQAALLYEQTGELERAAAAWEATLRANPRDTVARERLAAVRQRIAEGDGAP